MFKLVYILYITILTTALVLIGMSKLQHSRHGQLIFIYSFFKLAEISDKFVHKTIPVHMNELIISCRYKVLETFGFVQSYNNKAI